LLTDGGLGFGRIGAGPTGRALGLAALVDHFADARHQVDERRPHELDILEQR
jgi:hypothetical protein